MSGESPQSEEDQSYRRLASLLLGSCYVNFSCQSFSPQDRIRRDYTRIVGIVDERAPLLSDSSFPEQEVSFCRLKSLGGLPSILFNTQQQETLLNCLQASTVILGDNGTGKTVLLTSAANKLASQRDVHFLSALGNS